MIVLLAPMAWPQSFDSAAAALARKIAALIQQREPVALSFRNLSSMSAQEVSSARSALERELGAQGLAVRAAPGIELVVTMAENARGYLWVAEVRRGDTREVVMEQAAMPRAAAPVAPALNIEKKLLFEQDEPVLDVGPGTAPGAGTLVVLDRAGVSLHEKTETPRVPISRAWPRDLRGRLAVEGAAYQAFLPGARCHGMIVNGLSVTCNDDVLWPIGSGMQAAFTPNRNLFDGRVLLSNGTQKNLPAFYSAASVQDRGRTEWLFAGADGRTYLYDSALAPNGSWSGWGSDIAGVESDCGARSQVLATGPGDGAVADTVTAYEIADGRPQPVTDAAAFPGPVTALWASPERGAAFAISRDLKSGRYAAFRLSITCAH
ncbi:MAG TPA: hypothetical protein VJN43_22135 [Bryobacteraceae bacterium]|nr:hypothetical protein [Bryobacteraceae bacterium]